MNYLKYLLIGIVLGVLAIIGYKHFFQPTQMEKCMDYFQAEVRDDVEWNVQNKEFLKQWCEFLIANGLEF